MPGLGEFINAIIGMVQTLADGYTSNYAGKLKFQKEGEILNAVVNNVQQRYSGLEDAIGEAAIAQYSSKLQEETENKVAAGNLVSIITAVVFVVVVLVLLMWVTKSKK